MRESGKEKQGLFEADWQAVAWKLQHRWNELSATRVWINVATR
jgi:hypothetical protein